MSDKCPTCGHKKLTVTEKQKLLKWEAEMVVKSA